MLSSYIFMLLDSHTLMAIRNKVPNFLFRTLFVMLFKTARLVAKLRWKYKFFGLPIDYKLYTFARSINHTF